jgi:hypothetical protein
LPTPRGLSQAPTSFIGSWYQDIHRLPLVACHNNTLQTTKIATKRCSRPLYSSQNTGRNTNSVSTTTLKQHSAGETTHPQKHHQKKFGESRPQPPTTPTHTSQYGCDPEKPVQDSLGVQARFLRTQQRASTIHSIPSTFHTPEEVVLASAIPLHI